MSPLVSVVIPCYNAESFVAETIKSAFAQTYKNLEIIVIDDESTDGSREVLRSFGSKIRSEFAEHMGASEARNRGTKLAKGEFIQYLDADDLLHPHAIEVRVNKLQETDADVAYSDWQELNETGEREFSSGEIHNQKIEDVHSDTEIALFTEFWVPPAALLYRRRIIDRIGLWNKNLPIIQDARFLLDAGLKGGKFVHVPGVTASYRVHRKESLSRRDPSRFMKDVLANAIEVQEIWEKRGLMSEDQKKVLVSTYEYAARHFFELQSLDFEFAMRRLRLLEKGWYFRYSFLAETLKSLLGYSLAHSMMSLLVSIKRNWKK